MRSVTKRSFKVWVACLSISFFVLHTEVTAQSYFIDLVFTNPSEGSCIGGTGCHFRGVTFRSGSINNSFRNVYFYDTLRINALASLTTYEIHGKMSCSEEPSHDCDIYHRMNVNMPPINSVEYFETGRFLYCREYNMEKPQDPISGGGIKGCGATHVNLSIGTLGDSHQWQASIKPGIWKDIPSAASRECSVPRSTLESMFGGNLDGTNLFFRCKIKDCYTRVSPISTRYVFYFAGPTASFIPVDPTCNGYKDGQIQVTITSPTPEINDFKIDLYDTMRSKSSLTNVDLIDHSTYILTSDDLLKKEDSIPGSTYAVIVTNNTNTTKLGSCPSIRYEGIRLNNPSPVTVSFTPSSYNGSNLKCHGDNTGTLEVFPSGGTGSYKEFEWTPNVSATSSTTSSKAINLTAQTYKVKLKDSRGCKSGEFAKELIAPSPLAVTANSAGGLGEWDVSCWNKTDGKITTTVSGGTGEKKYSWITGATTDYIDNAGPGLYDVTVTDANGCAASDDEELTSPEPIDFSIEQLTPVECPGSPTASLEAQSVTHTIGEKSYLWSSGEETSSVSGKKAGTHWLKISDQQGCSTTKSKELFDPPAYTVAIAPVSDHNGSYITCNGMDDGKLSAAVRDHNNNPAVPQHYDWYKNNNPYDNGASLNSIDELERGTYKVMITYGAGCTAGHTYILNDPNPVAPVITASSNHNGVAISCPGASDGSLHAAGSGGTGSAYTYLWDTGTPGADLTGKPAGTYTVTATDINGCTGSGSQMISNPPPINPSIAIKSNYNNFAVDCHNATNGRLEVTSSGGAGTVTYTWNTGVTGFALSNVGPGTYSVIAKDANDCTMSDAETIINPPPITASIAISSDFNGQPISCFNEDDGSLTVSGSGGTNSFTYLWSTGGTANLLSGVPAGLYSVTVRDTNGCPATNSETLENPDPVVASITEISDYNGYGVSCTTFQDGYLQASGAGGTRSYTFLWPAISGTNSRASDLGAGSYTVRITDSNGCSDTESANITAPPILNLSLDDKKNILCFDGESGELTLATAGGVGGYEYSINTTDWQTSNIFPLLRASGYTVQVRDDNGCVDELTEVLSQPAKIEIDFTTQPAFCADPRGEAAAIVRGGVGTYAYRWEDANNTTISTTTSITNKAAGIYLLKVTDSNLCPMEETVGITTTDGPKAIVIEVVDAKCSYSSDGSSLLEITEGDGPFELLWPNGQTTLQGLNLAKGVYQVTITDVNDCISIQPVSVGAPEELDINLVKGTNPGCYGFCDGEIQVQGVGGTGAYTYNWTGQSGSTAVNLCIGDHSVRITDENSCEAEKIFNLIQPDPLVITLVERKLPLCYDACNGSIEVRASGGNDNYKYTWTSGATTSLAQNICAGEHAVKVTDGKDCLLERTYSLGEPDLLQVRLSGKKIPICHDGCDGELNVNAFGGTGAYNYTWNTGQGSHLIADLCSSDYDVQVTDQNNCTVSGTYTIENPPALEIDLGGSVMLCTGQSHLLNAGASWTKHIWGSNAGFTANTSTVTIKDAGQYWVELHNSDNCVARDTFLLETSIDLLKANFFVTTEATVGDTIVMIDVSWPLPENTIWEYPSAMRKIFDLGEVIYGQFDDEGLYQIKLNARLGGCNDSMAKTITILKSKEDVEGGRLGYEKFVKKFELYPNPTEGNFDVSVELAAESQITLSVWNGGTSLLMGKVVESGKKRYLTHFDLRPLSSGTYILRLDHKKGKEYIRFVVH